MAVTTAVAPLRGDESATETASLSKELPDLAQLDARQAVYEGNRLLLEGKADAALSAYDHARKEFEALERFARGEQMLVEYIAMGGSLDPDPDPTSPFDVPEEWRPDVAHGRAGLRLLRRGAG